MAESPDMFRNVANNSLNTNVSKNSKGPTPLRNNLNKPTVGGKHSRPGSATSKEKKAGFG
jgi:hypothetical protein